MGVALTLGKDGKTITATCTPDAVIKASKTGKSDIICGTGGFQALGEYRVMVTVIKSK